MDPMSLLSSRRGLATRPELKESQALVAAACEAYNREKYAPFVPSVLLGFSTTSSEVAAVVRQKVSAVVMTSTP